MSPLENATKTAEGVVVKGFVLSPVVEQCSGCDRVREFDGEQFCSSYPNLMPTTGSLPGIKAFTAAVFGGIGSIPGAFLGGLLLGVIEALAAGYIAIAWKDAIAFLVLILILIIRPTGILGERTADKL